MKDKKGREMCKVGVQLSFINLKYDENSKSTENSFQKLAMHNQLAEETIQQLELQRRESTGGLRSAKPKFKATDKTNRHSHPLKIDATMVPPAQATPRDYSHAPLNSPAVPHNNVHLHLDVQGDNLNDEESKVLAAPPILSLNHSNSLNFQVFQPQHAANFQQRVSLPLVTVPTAAVSHQNAVLSSPVLAPLAPSQVPNSASANVAVSPPTLNDAVPSFVGDTTANESDLEDIMSMGFSREKSIEALNNSNNDKTAAVEYLLQN